jgi:hypothetical protein
MAAEPDWLNRRLEFRYATVLTASVGLVLALLVAFSAGHAYRTPSEEQHAILRQTYDQDPPFWQRKLNESNYPKAEIREIIHDGSAVVAPAGDEPVAAIASPNQDSEKPVVPYCVQIATVEGSDRAVKGQRLGQYVDAQLERAGIAARCEYRDAGKAGRHQLEVFVAPFASSEEAASASQRIKEFKAFLGTNFSDVYVRRHPGARSE